MDKSLEKTTNEEIIVLKLKLEIVEKELQLALERAESAESELKKLHHLKSASSILVVDKPSLPPPPPPPIPKTILYTNNSFKQYNKPKQLFNDHCKIQSQQQVESTGG